MVEREFLASQKYPEWLFATIAMKPTSEYHRAQPAGQMPTDKRRREFLLDVLTNGACLVLAAGFLPGCLAAVGAAESPRPQAEDLEKLAYCGFDCTTCDVFRATRENDIEAKEKVARRWKDRLGVDVAPEKVACDGCRSNTGRLGYHCEFVCDVRRCARAKGASACALCADFPTCDKALWRTWTAMHDRTAERYRALHGGSSRP